MTRDAMPIQTMTELFEKQPCWMIQPLADAMHYSIPSVRRFLAEAEYYSSFTHNGRWYTLRRIPRFNRDGLWFHQNIGFSRAGSLTNTLIALIGRSPAGMSAEQLGAKLGVSMSLDFNSIMSSPAPAKKEVGVQACLPGRRSRNSPTTTPRPGRPGARGRSICRPRLRF